MIRPFDLTGPLPEEGTTTVLEASAGTGKTFALAGLVTRYLADGVATVDQMLLISFSRAASRELRERVRDQILSAALALDAPGPVEGNEIVRYLGTGTESVRARRRANLHAALAGFDAATIATTHEFCHLVLKSLGVAGDTDSGVELVENLEALVSEVVDDLYLAHFGQQGQTPAMTRREAGELARDVVANPGTDLRPVDPVPESVAAVRVRFARDVLAEVERRKRRNGILGFDDLLSRLADALEPPDSPARARMSRRWKIVMVDEFQDTDRVQWHVIERAFAHRCTLILIGDPKQAIYAFRGGDVATYLEAAGKADDTRTLATNWRSDRVLVDSLHTVLRSAELGDSGIVVRDVAAHHQGHRLAGAPHNAPFRLRVVSRARFGAPATKTIQIDALREHILADLVADVRELLGSGATYEGRPVAAGDIAVIVENHKDAGACHRALIAAGIHAVHAGDGDVFGSAAAEDWLCLLEAFDQPHRSGLVRAAAATRFFGESAASLAEGGEALTDAVAQTLREWADHGRERGVAAVFEAAQLAGMGRRVLAWRGGERHMTDLAHLAELLQQTAHREHFGLPALLAWLRAQRTAARPSGRTRRLDSAAAAVQVQTVWASKGLQYPLVYLPFAFNRHVQSRDQLLFHDNGVRCLHVGGKASPDVKQANRISADEDAGDHLRLTYVALTRAQSQVVVWWGPSWDERNGGLSRLLRGRSIDEAGVPNRCEPKTIRDEEALACFRAWAAHGGPTVEDSVVAADGAIPAVAPRTELSARHFHRAIDTGWRRTSYSGLIRAAASHGVSSEPEIEILDDEVDEVEEVGEVADIPITGEPAGPPHDPVSPMADLPGGTSFGSLVHGVLETVDPLAANLTAEIEQRVREQTAWWPVDATPAELAAALLPMYATPLGPLADDLTLRQIGRPDQLRELDFEVPLAGGDRATSASACSRLADVGRLLREHLADDDPMLPYADRLIAPGLGGQSLRGYLSGSIDAVLRIPPSAADGHAPRYLVVDYKTNRLGRPGRPLTAADYRRPHLTAAMLHTDYPLQALLYSVVLHRFLRWRQPGYDPDRHFGGVLYLFVRGMCGQDTPRSDGHPAGVFSWRPSTAAVTALSELLGHGMP